jgi:putative glycosyltransferase (TIGR04372 family)
VWASQLLPKNLRWISPPARFAGGSRDTDGLFEKIPLIQFRDDEEEKGKNWLKAQGWSEGEPFVCLLARDPSYLSLWLGRDRISRSQSGGFHDYRNSNISTYLEAAEWLATKGVWVIRMGSVVEKPFVSTNPRVVDYANSNSKSDFLDVWLFASCNFCITTGTGPDYVAQLFRRPTLLLNHLPLADTWISSFTVVAGKNLFWSDRGRLTLEEHVDACFFSSEDYAARGIHIEDLSPDTITQIVKEMWEIVKGDKRTKNGDLEWNARFLALLRQPKFRHLHNIAHPKAQLSSVWLRQFLQHIGQNP